MPFTPTETHLNLMRAFAGESQARNRYTIAAGHAKENNLYVLEEVFLYTAEQERAHAAVFYDLLKEAAGNTITVDGGYPVDIAPTLTDLLQAAQHNELAEANDIYPAFAAQAEKDGNTRAAAVFREIAKIEAVHADRFRQFETWMAGDALFTNNAGCTWMCQNCGHLHTGTQAPGICPVCLYEQGYFLRAEMAAYTNGVTYRQQVMA